LRPAVTAFAGGAAMPGQCGLGWGGSACDAAHVTMGAVVSAAAAQKLSLALIFVDIKSAFDTTMHQLALPDESAEDSIVRGVCSMGFAIEEALEIASDSLRLEEWGGAPAHLPQTIAMTTRSAWAMVDGSNAVAVQGVGVAAGTPLADVVFGVVASRISRRIHIKLREADLLVSFPTTEVANILGVTPPATYAHGYSVQDITYVDDSVFAQCGTAGQLLERTARTMAIIDTVYALHGFTLNMKRDKTSVVLNFVGAGSKEAKLSVLGATTIPYVARGALRHLQIVDEYRHLGGWLTRGSGVMNDVVKKASIIRIAAKPIRKQILGNRDVDVQTRLALANALVFSKALFMASAWPELLGSEHKFIHAAVLTAMRTVASEERWKKSKLTDVQVLASLRALPPNLMIRQKRMKLFLSLVSRRHWPALLLLTAGLTAPRSWLAAVVRDFQWLDGSITLSGWVTLTDADFKRVF
jgi:hypothetical protein